MSRLRFALLDASHGSGSTRRNFRRELDADLVEFAASDGELPDSYDYDGVVVTGSRASVYWDEAWIRPLVDYVAEADERGVPVLGVCYGHQVLAEALGGRVGGMDDFEIGYNEVEHLDNDPLFEGIDDQFTVFTTHGDAVLELPPGAELLAKNEFGVHAFRKGDSYGVQFHPEYDMETAREVSEGKRERLGDERVDGVLDGITAENFDAACEAKRLFDNFVAHAERARKERRDRPSAEL
ncbi:glutamine amidotransferase [Haloprofundus marisrubri]|uniref:Glutamine amidotransferase n=1 Tax=Haloprofundus marisrubri TaxID=1514971 RepID=A0A0W1R4E7_9EURY|nr:type 1 glutamine amidotransferase [Haloprofundus marisrubri]KTG08114.1 glutamine amidotransferase [Haloprofundus marisrubri]